MVVFRGVNKTVIIGILLVMLPLSFFLYQDYSLKKQKQLDVQNKNQLNQEAFDLCLKQAISNYRSEERNMCWIYNHDATGCDLKYMVDYELVKELPEDRLEADTEECAKKYPPDERLFSTGSPGLDWLPYGSVGEREAFKKVMQTEKFKVFSSPPLKEGYKITYEVNSPTKEFPYWIFRLYSYSDVEEKTFATFGVNAETGELKEVEG